MTKSKNKNKNKNKGISSLKAVSRKKVSGCVRGSAGVASMPMASQNDGGWMSTIGKVASTVAEYAPKVAQILGLGGYKLKANSLMGLGAPPVFARGEISVAHREFLTDVVGNTATFQLYSLYSINPGLPATFPWLSSIALNYESYVPQGLVFEYNPLSGYISSTVALGYVAMATQYDLNDPPFATKQEMEDYEYSNVGSPVERVLHGVECSPKSIMFDRLLTRGGNVPATANIQNYDQGLFTLAVGGQASATAVIGELRVSYHYRFSTPKLQQGSGSSLSYTHLTAAPTTNSQFASLAYAAGSNNAISVSNPTLTTLVLGSVDESLVIGSNYLVVIWSIADTTYTPSSLFSVPSGNQVPWFSSASAPAATYRMNASSTASTIYAMVCKPTFNSSGFAGVTITYAAPSTVTSAALSDIFIIQLPTGVSLTSSQMAKVIAMPRLNYYQMESILEEPYDVVCSSASGSSSSSCAVVPVGIPPRPKLVRQ